MTIEEKVTQIGPDKLGNGGAPESDVLEWATTAGETMRFQQFWHGGLLEYPTPDGRRDVLTIAEASLAANPFV